MKHPAVPPIDEVPPPVVSVIERRLAGHSVFAPASIPIPLHDPRWVVRWENASISPDHLWQILHQLGWQYVAPADLACPMDEIGAYERDGRIVRGDKGTEVLVKMRADDYAAVQQQKTRENIASTFSRAAITAAVVSGVGQQHGDEAAQFVSQRVQGLHVTDQRGPQE